MSHAQHPEAFVYEAIRLPRGRMRTGGGTLADIPPYELFAQLLREFTARGIDAAEIDDVIVGVSTAVGEQSADLARVAILQAGWPDTVPGAVVSRLCCSGLDAIGVAAAKVASGQCDLVVGGGAESMSRVTMFSDHPPFAESDSVGETTGFVPIGVSADFTAVSHGISRSELDDYSVRSHQLAASAPRWDSMIAARSGGEVVLAADEGARPAVTSGDLADLVPLFTGDPAWGRIESRFHGVVRPEVGLHTVATAPQMCDCASAVLVGSAEAAGRVGHRPRARIAGFAQVAERSPRLDGTVRAARRALEMARADSADVEVAEINESFAVTPLVLARALAIDLDKVNRYGGAVAVGHPLGASGGILVANALETLERVGGRFALVAIPAALGLATALVLERV